MNASSPNTSSPSTSTPELIRGLHNIRPRHHGSVVTIGSFDGVHLGHQAILRQVRQQAARLGLPAVVMIFEPQPHEFFAGEKAPARLMRLRDKILALFAEGIDRVCCLPFNDALSQLTATDFIQRILLAGLGTRCLVIGDDFHFGNARTGNVDLLQAAGRQHNFQVMDNRTLLLGGERVSSTRIRELLWQNAFDQAAKLLGRPYSISGKVVKGKQLGRQLGAPTANIHLHRYRSPLSGVFAVTARVENGQWQNGQWESGAPKKSERENAEPMEGVANVGIRPTVGGDDKPLLEVHLFDRDIDLYQQTLVVEFKHKLREEKRFSSLEELTHNIHRDMRQARNFFAKPHQNNPVHTKN